MEIDLSIGNRQPKEHFQFKHNREKRWVTGLNISTYILKDSLETGWKGVKTWDQKKQFYSKLYEQKAD